MRIEKTYWDLGMNIKDIADDFYVAYKRCTEGKNPHIDESGRYVMETVNVPALVNAAFACELYLKKLIKDDTTRGHDLEVLFGQLEANDKDKIQAIISRRLQEESLEKGFDYYLKGISNDFEFWRYIHEKPDFGELGLNIGLRAIDCFVKSLKEYSDSLE